MPDRKGVRPNYSAPEQETDNLATANSTRRGVEATHHSESDFSNEGTIMTASTNETPVLDLLASMTADSVATSTLDPETLMLVRIAALVAVDAPSISYLLNLGTASQVGVDAEQARGVLAAVAPIVGTARVASATGKIADALEVAIEVADRDAQING